MQQFLKFIFGIKLYMFPTVSKPVWHTPLLCVQWKTPDDEQRNCRKHVQFYSKNKCEKLAHLFGFIIRGIEYYQTSIVECGLNKGFLKKKK